MVPFKDVKTFLFAIQFARKEISALKALVVGDLHEDPTYSDECMALASALGLADCVEFTGTVRILEVLPRVHLAVLTSMTESQPLAILEAGAAGICCIATDVGGCRELLLGREERQEAAPGGIVVPAFDATAIGRAVVDLLRDNERRQRYAENLRIRIQRHHDRKQVQEAYAAVYNKYCSAPDLVDAFDET